mmetsp:Transcript_3212/g.3808  ORF Transcript_3212/g.3808 Transcript_3212/m.3808 type:complete len:472 (-) Transcript_3212:1170-2585(-)
MLILYHFPNPLLGANLQSAGLQQECLSTPQAFRAEGPFPFKLQHLKKVFPESGEFHFRLKIPHPVSTNQYAWKDLVDDNEVLSSSKRDSFELKVLPINISESDSSYDCESPVSKNQELPESSMNIDLAEINSQLDDMGIQSEASELMSEPLGSPHSAFTRIEEKVSDSNTPGSSNFGDVLSGSDSDNGSDFEMNELEKEDEASRYELQQQRLREQFRKEKRQETSKGIFGSGGKSIGSSVGGFFKSATKAAANLAKEVSEQHGVNLGVLGKNSAPSSRQRETLKRIRSQLGTKFSCENIDHLELLKRVWSKSFPEEDFLVCAPQWQLLGFNVDRVEEDKMVEATGVLGIRCLTRFAQDYSGDISHCLAESLPLAQVLLRCVHVLSKHIGIVDGSFQRSRKKYWEIFNDQAVFSRINSITVHIALMERKVDSSLSVKDMVRRAVGQTKHVLDEGPKDIEEFKHIATALGIQI